MAINHEPTGGLSLYTVPQGLHQHDLHAHDSLAVIMLTHDRKTYHVEGKHLRVLTGQIAIANPGELHGCEYVGSQPWAHRTWYLSAELVTMLSVEIGLKRIAEITHSVIDCSRTRNFLLDAHHACDTGNELDQEAAAVEAMSVLLGRYGSERVATNALVSKAAASRVAIYIDLLDANARAPLSLALLAEHASVGRYQVIRDFRQVLHMSPGDYLRYVRLKNARQLLRNGATLIEAAMDAGYSDQSHFSRVFKRVFGYTPSHYLSAINPKTATSQLN
jgi:AraC-like DNA-binding protein